MVSNINSRADGRAFWELRPLQIVRGVVPYAEGSALVEWGRTRVVCTASCEERVPTHRRGKGLGWVTAEYGMLPRATEVRTEREAVRGRQMGRTVEIQRLIGRCLRAAVDFAALGERQITVDCDVLVADGGTRMAAVTGGWVALAEACAQLVQRGVVKEPPLRRQVAGVSVGMVEGEAMVDLCYAEDAAAEVDGSVVLTPEGDVVEVHFAAEQQLLGREMIRVLIDLAAASMGAIFAAQRRALERERTDGLTMGGHSEVAEGEEGGSEDAWDRGGGAGKTR
ncbi:MAG: ribonuclease PH [Hydrogenophilus sp.]|nr:ribonuclease PH [Hydrogenophilus sp.]